ncbi:MAG: hypothetical protein GDA50_06995 [Alphaproteobacteria bacterium GM202ARS2]|nr:hypothetical protein [Alphaproteobacteria bacterium GM202ARS2]
MNFSDSPHGLHGAKIRFYKEDDILLYEGTIPSTVVLDAGRGFFSGATYRIEYEKAGSGQTTSVLSVSTDPLKITGVIGAFAAFFELLFLVVKAVGYLFVGFIELFGVILDSGTDEDIIIDPETADMWRIPSFHFTDLGVRALRLTYGDKDVKVGFVDSPEERRFVEAVGERVDLQTLGIDITVHQAE